MASTEWAKRYAQAVFDIATSSPDVDVDKSLDNWMKELDSAIQPLTDSQFLAFLRHAKIPFDKKIEAVSKVLPNSNPLLRNLVGLLVSKGRIEGLQEVKSEFNKLLDHHRGIERVKTYSAIELEQSDRDRITEYVQNMVNKEIVLETEVDTSILGGLVIRVGDKLIDGSTRSKLLSLKNELESASMRSGNSKRNEEART
jgi:F-type H+-transporting ATPase subunit delta